MYLIYRCLSSVSAVIRSWFIYELLKSTTIVFSPHFLLQNFNLWNPPHAFGFPIVKYPPMPSEFHGPEPPLPFGNPKSRPWYRYGYFLESPISKQGFLQSKYWEYKTDILWKDINIPQLTATQTLQWMFIVEGHNIIPHCNTHSAMNV